MAGPWIPQQRRLMLLSSSSSTSLFFKEALRLGPGRRRSKQDFLPPLDWGIRAARGVVLRQRQQQQQLTTAQLSSPSARERLAVRRDRQQWGAALWVRATGRRDRTVARALPDENTYWITALQAITVSGLMAAFAVISGIVINIKIEEQAVADFKELEKDGRLPDVAFSDEDLDSEDPVYIFSAKDTPSSRASRNRPVREELEPELEPANKE